MSRLHASFPYSDLKCLLNFIKSFPNLQFLILVCYCSYEEMSLEEINQISLSSIPECLLSSLEYIDFKFPSQGDVAPLKIVRYFLTNTSILKKLTLRLPNYSILKVTCVYI
ncbi:hypothetical protein CARUB_v10027709mg [Capsella rubella]|uniref:FBD domain-containing protein n=1 Tax=Capsella rubella TaxID=81985 RepID=R0GTM9_9BRAS|nr:hypothetical protein CARUB_v10027709mg [Capsella rubella]